MLVLQLGSRQVFTVAHLEDEQLGCLHSAQGSPGGTAGMEMECVQHQAYVWTVEFRDDFRGLLRVRTEQER